MHGRYNEPMGPKTRKLITVLDAIIALLEGNNEKYWSEWMRDARSRLQQSDYTGIEKLLGAFGGMGSFNDLLLEKSQQELNDLQNEAYRLGKAIKREHDSGS